MNSCMTNLYKGSTPTSSKHATPSGGSRMSSRSGTPSRSVPNSTPSSGQSSPRRTSSWCGKDNSTDAGNDLQKALFVIDRVGALKEKARVTPVVESPLAKDCRKTPSASDKRIDLSGDSLNLINPVSIETMSEVQRHETKKDDLNISSARTERHESSVTGRSVDAGIKTGPDKDSTPVREVGSYTVSGYIPATHVLTLGSVPGHPIHTFT